MINLYTPKNFKFPKIRRGRNKGNATSGNKICFGKYAIIAKEHGNLNGAQIEASRRVFTNYFKRFLKLWITVFPTHTFTKKSKDVKLGKGKGAVEYWYLKIKPGRIIFELDNVKLQDAILASKIVFSKLPFKCSFIIKK